MPPFLAFLKTIRAILGHLISREKICSGNLFGIGYGIGS